MLFENIKNQQLLAAFWCFPFSLQRLSDYAQMCVCVLFTQKVSLSVVELKLPVPTSCVYTDLGSSLKPMVVEHSLP